MGPLDKAKEAVGKMNDSELDEAWKKRTGHGAFVPDAKVSTEQISKNDNKSKPAKDLRD